MRHICRFGHLSCRHFFVAGAVAVVAVLSNIAGPGLLTADLQSRTMTCAPDAIVMTQKGAGSMSVLWHTQDTHATEATHRVVGCILVLGTVATVARAVLSRITEALARPADLHASKPLWYMCRSPAHRQPAGCMPTADPQHISAEFGLTYVEFW